MSWPRAAVWIGAIALIAAGLWVAFARRGGGDGLTVSARVLRVIDGDTIVVRRAGERATVRVLGIDTPESHKPHVGVECGARAASASLRRMLAPAGRGREVTLVYDRHGERVDGYGRVLAYVIPGAVARRRARTVERAQLAAGWAMVYRFRGRRLDRQAALYRAMGAARRAHRGVWGRCRGDFHSLQAGAGTPTPR